MKDLLKIRVSETHNDIESGITKGWLIKEIEKGKVRPLLHTTIILEEGYEFFISNIKQDIKIDITVFIEHIQLSRYNFNRDFEELKKKLDKNWKWEDEK